jgi:hypothetical protein
LERWCINLAISFGKRTGSILLCALLGIGSCLSGCSKDESAKRAETEKYVLSENYYAASRQSGSYGEYKLVAESESHRLYMREEDLAIAVEDVATGSFMESAISNDDGRNNKTWLGAMKSALVLTLINGGNDTKQADLINDKITKKIEYSDNGFKAECFWTKYQFGLTMQVALEGGSVVAHVDDSSIIEKSDQYKIGTISIYPFMGNSYMDEKEGYILIPDGNGALIYLDDKEGRFQTGFSSMIYGGDVGFNDSSVVNLLWDRYSMVTDAEPVLAPVFGIAHTDDEMAYLAVVESGDNRATIEAHPNGVSVDYNRAYAKFIERKLYTQPTSNNSTSGSLHLMESDRSHSDLRVRYIFLSGDEADYSGMAVAYREYLLKNGGLVQSDMTYRTRVDFLGGERENWVVGTSSVIMTTTSDIEDICEDLVSNGAGSLFSIYKGWQSGGLYDLPITSYSADSGIGGTSSVTKLMKKMKDDGNRLYLYDNALLLNPDESTAAFNVINQVNKRRYTVKTYKDVYDEMMYLAPVKSYKNLEKVADALEGKEGSGICVAGITDNIFSYNYGGNTFSRYDCADTFARVIDAAASKTGLVLEQPFAYLWKNTESFVDIPLYTSSYIVEDTGVPFLSIVFSGVVPVYAEYVNFEANKQEFFLKMVETGAYPSFYITKKSSDALIYTNSSDIYSSQYEVYKDTILDYDKKLSALNEKTNGAHIKKHEIKGDGMIAVEYDNGVRILINYNNSERTIDGVTVEAMSYETI